MGGQAAEQIIAGVVLSERLAVTMYGAIHRAQFGGQRNLRGLVVDSKMLEESAFRIPLTDAKNIGKLTKLDHPNIVPTVAVESGGPDVVVVTRGGGRYVSVQDLIEAAKAKSRQGGKLAMPIAALIGKSVIEALATAHKAGIIHGAVHPRSVLIDEDGVVRLSDFIVGRALTTAVAQGADSSLWRGLTGYIAPELVVGEDPTPGVDVFAVGALLFTMLSGEVPPGSLRATPAIERLVQRALDTDTSRRYKSATDMLENLLEALEDDRWELAEPVELIKEAGLSATDENIDDATEDLLASLGKGNMQVTAPQSRAKEEPPSRASSAGGGLDELISGLGDDTGMTQIDDAPPKRRDPISDIIRKDPRKGEAIVSSARVPSLDDPDDEDEPPPRPTPVPQRNTPRAVSFQDGVASQPRRRSDPAIAVRPPDGDSEAAALAAIGDLDEPARRMSTVAEQAAAAAAKLEAAAARVERASQRAESGAMEPVVRTPARGVVPIVDPIDTSSLPPPKLKSAWRGVFGGVVVLAIIGGLGYGIYAKLEGDKAQAAKMKADRERLDKEKEEAERKHLAGNADSGSIEVSASENAGIWLRLGRTPLTTTIKLVAANPHQLVLLRDGHDPTEAQIDGTHWKGAADKLKATLSVNLKASAKPTPMPFQPKAPPPGSTGVVGAGFVHIESTPSDAEVWLFLGVNNARFNELVAGRDYEVRVVPQDKTKKTAIVEFKTDEWRDNDPNTPIDAAKKKPVLSKSVTLEADPDAKGKKGK